MSLKTNYNAGLEKCIKQNKINFNPIKPFNLLIIKGKIIVLDVVMAVVISHFFVKKKCNC